VPAVGYPDLLAYIHNSYLMKMYQYEYFGSEAGDAAEGACGAPVYQQTDSMVDVWAGYDRRRHR
jgi:hypothetical protein